MQAKKSAYSWIVNESLVLSFSFFLVHLFYLILFIYRYIFYLFLFLVSLMVFAQTHDWISTKPTTVENCTHCSISHSEEIKYTADNSLSIREAVVIEDVRLFLKM